jgi:hypothetical protein
MNYRLTIHMYKSLLATNIPWDSSTTYEAPSAVVNPGGGCHGTIAKSTTNNRVSELYADIYGAYGLGKPTFNMGYRNLIFRRVST